MWSSASTIAAGDTVILWLTRDALQPLSIEPGKEFNSKFGSYRHADLIGVPYGSKVGSRTGKGFIHVLRPTPELWTMALPHRTQILYLADIAFITSYLNIKSGSKIGLHLLAVSEASQPTLTGTGSGSFSHSVIRTIGSSGHLWSYEFHETRANKARQEFIRHGLSDRVTLTHQNVCKDGFTVTDVADALFLDLPAPWDAVEHAKKALRKDRITRICCFSPCMEQVLRTVSALNEAGFSACSPNTGRFEEKITPDLAHVMLFTHRSPQLSVNLGLGAWLPESMHSRFLLQSLRRWPLHSPIRKLTTYRVSDIEMYESLLRPYDIQQTPALPTISQVSDKLKQSEIKREEKRLKQIASGPRGPGGAFHGEKRKRDGKDGEDPMPENPSATGKRAKTEDAEISNTAAEPESQSTMLEYVNMNQAQTQPTEAPISVPPMKLNFAKVMPEVRGHTSYLTFACLLPPGLVRIGIVSDATTATPDIVQ
ncbi:hypothetical protein D9757_007019 [Collybiopsis confluens]|uniref:tRNA (adenine(58)-N(1))-methyltransferase catalytic subunit TRM61 n=1 Tax=Collybiopsis confluens TaxID=2823264 RepID=A0A8H5M4S4_9AGAR|nr:hypothetical protein D9757_007019 [Collybiopsis confluens]